MNKQKLLPSLEDHIKERHSERAVYGYLRMIDQYLKTTGPGKAATATYADITAYIETLRSSKSPRTGKPLHPKTLRNHLYAVKMYYQWLLDTGRRNDHPCRDLFLKDPISKAIPVENLLSREQLDELLQTHRAKLLLVRSRDTIILSLLAGQAITVFEIIHLKVDDLDLRKGTLYVAGSPKTSERTLPLKPEQILLFQDYLERTRPLLLKNSNAPSREDTETLILSVRGNRMRPGSISAMFGRPLSSGQKVTPQLIRQSVIAHLLKSGQDLRVIQAFTGHKRISSVEAYRQSGLDELKAVIGKLHPLQ